MTDPQRTDLPAEAAAALAEQKFQQLDLQAIGLQPADFNEVMAARKELAEIRHNAVAEYGKKYCF